MSCKVKKQESPEYYTVENLKTLGSHLKLNLTLLTRKIAETNTINNSCNVMCTVHHHTVVVSTLYTVV